MLKTDGVFKMLIEVQREYNSLMPLEMQEQDENWFDDIDEKIMSLKYKIHNWIRDAEHERKERLSPKSRSVTSKHSSSRKSSSSSSSSRSPKDKIALPEKLRMAEFLAEAEFLKKRQSAKCHEEKLTIKEEYAKSKAKVKILEANKSEDHKMEINVDGQYKGEINKVIDEKPEIKNQRTKQYHYDQTTVGDGKFDFSPIK